MFTKALAAGLSGARVKILRRSINSLSRKAKTKGLDKKKVDDAIKKLAKAYDTEAQDQGLFIKSFTAALQKELDLSTDNNKAQPTSGKVVSNLAKLRHETYKIAVDLAKRNHIAGIVKELNEGYGYCVTDLPAHFVHDDEKERALWCWWLLVSLSGLAYSATDNNIIGDVLGRDIAAEYKDFLYKKKLKGLTTLYNYSPASFLEKEILMSISEESFVEFLALANNCRKIHRLSSGEVWKTYENIKKDSEGGKAK